MGYKLKNIQGLQNASKKQAPLLNQEANKNHILFANNEGKGITEIKQALGITLKIAENLLNNIMPRLLNHLLQKLDIKKF